MIHFDLSEPNCPRRLLPPLAPKVSAKLRKRASNALKTKMSRAKVRGLGAAAEIPFVRKRLHVFPWIKIGALGL